MNFSLKSPLLIAGTILILLSAGGLGCHLLKSKAPLDVTIENPSDTDSLTEKGQIIIYLSGEVRNPGIYTLKTGSRLYQAVELAGGFTEEADKVAVNLACKLEDEDHIHISKKGEISSSPFGPSSPGKININTASQSELETLPGIGPTLASRIIEYRKTTGPFKAVEDIKKVSGIGDKRFEAIKDLITVR